MANTTFEERLRAMEREVRALKVAHERPLGSVSFYHYEHTFLLSELIGSYCTLIAQSADGSPVPPLYEIACRMSITPNLLYFSKAAFSDDNKTAYFYFSLRTGALPDDTPIVLCLTAGAPMNVTFSPREENP